MLSNGNPVSGGTVNCQIIQGSGVLSGSTAPTDSNGYASVNLQLTSVSSAVQVTACAAPGNSPCQTFTASVVALGSLQIQPVAGVLQIAAPGQNFSPLRVRVTDSSSAPNPVLGANIFFQDYVGRLPQNEPIVWLGDAGISQPAMPVILAESQLTVQSDVNGFANFPLSTAGVNGDVAILGSASAGNASLHFAAQQLGP